MASKHFRKSLVLAVPPSLETCSQCVLKFEVLPSCIYLSSPHLSLPTLKCQNNIMASTGDSEIEAEIPSFETLVQRAWDGDHPKPQETTHAGRLYWNLQGPLSGAVTVMDTNWNLDAPREPYCQSVSPLSWHSISQEPFTTPKVSSISVTVDDLEQYVEKWLDGHEPHADTDDCEWGQLEGGGSEPELLRCCGTDRPREIPPLVVMASEKPFVTVHDYVSAVHPWLLSLRDQILWALSDIPDDKPLPAGTKLCVTRFTPDSLWILEEDEWVSHIRSFNNAPAGKFN